VNPFSQIVSEYANVLPMAATLAGVIGLFLGAVGLRMMSISKLRGEPQLKGVWTFMAGSILTNLWVWLSGFSQTFIQTSGTSSLAYAGGGSGASSFIPFAIDTIQIIGVFGFIRGAMGLRDDRQEGKAIPIGQMSFGALAMNSVPFLHLVGNTIGGQLQSFINTIIP